MINPVITYYQQQLEGMPYFGQVYGLCELKEQAQGIVMPVFYTSADKKWNTVKINKDGLAYMRTFGSTQIAEAPSNRACEQMQEFTTDIRIVAMAKRATFPNDDAVSSHRLAATITKALTFTNGPLRAQIQAAKLLSRATVYSTDSRTIKAEEFPNLSTKDFNFDDIFCAVNVQLTITTYNTCIIDPCEYEPRFCFLLPNKVAIPT